MMKKKILEAKETLVRGTEAKHDVGCILAPNSVHLRPKTTPGISAPMEDSEDAEERLADEEAFMAVDESGGGPLPPPPPSSLLLLSLVGAPPPPLSVATLEGEELHALPIAPKAGDHFISGTAEGRRSEQCPFLLRVHLLTLNLNRSVVHSPVSRPLLIPTRRATSSPFFFFFFELRSLPVSRECGGAETAATAAAAISLAYL